MEKIPTFNTNEGEQKVDSNSQEVGGSSEQPKNIEKFDGVMRKIANLVAKHPRLADLGIAIGLVVTLRIGMTTESNDPSSHDKESEVAVIDDTDISRGETLEFTVPPEITGKVPQIVLTQIEIYGTRNREDLLKQADEKLPETLISGFENFQLSNEEIRKIFTETIPRGFNLNIDEIKYVDISPDIGDSYGIVSNTNSLSGKAAATAFIFENRIELYKSKASRETAANLVFLHEVFHFNSWMQNEMLTVQERLDLLASVVKRLESPDRYKSEYVESIKNQDKKKEMALKADEYFAEIGAAYLSPDFDLLPTADKDLVRDYIAKIDPEFKRGDALRKRDEILNIKPFGDELGKSQEDLEKEWQEIAEKSWEQIVEALTKEGAYQKLSEEYIQKEKEEHIQEIIKIYRGSNDKLGELLKNRYTNYEKQ